MQNKDKEILSMKKRLRYTFRHTTCDYITHDIIEEENYADIEGDRPTEENKKLALKKITEEPGWTEEDSYFEKIELLYGKDPVEDLPF